MFKLLYRIFTSDAWYPVLALVVLVLAAYVKWDCKKKVDQYYRQLKIQRDGTVK
jgi:hypothetical protein